MNSISTRTAREGDYVYLKTATPIVSGGVVLVPVDSYVQGIVIHSKRSGRVKGVAELGIRIETLTMSSGKVIKMTPKTGFGGFRRHRAESGGQRERGEAGNVARRGRCPHRRDQRGGRGDRRIADRSWKGAGIGAGAGSAVGLATVLLTRGREVELRQGSTIDVIFDRPVTID